LAIRVFVSVAGFRLDLTEEDRTVLSQGGAPGDVVQRVVEGITEFLDEHMPPEKKRRPSSDVNGN
jgi:hypothetical protein